ncbi:hypothetical protein VE03_02399 [Pseudogymnoascus sp. 23342-1-I1]|nr:hypothetical protein VE03_02399 [Pseudogymnoascus sp. 23342-1-I1]
MTKTFPFIQIREFTYVPGNVTIDDLPDELIISIARFITMGINADARSGPDMDAANLSLLTPSLCSHRFHSLAEPKFLIRLLTRPDLGRRVRFIHWEDILGYAFPVTCFGEEGWKTARNRIMGLYESPTERDAWDETVEEVGLEAIVALLFVLTPNLEELVLKSCDPIG